MRHRIGVLCVSMNLALGYQPHLASVTEGHTSVLFVMNAVHLTLWLTAVRLTQLSLLQRKY